MIQTKEKSQYRKLTRQELTDRFYFLETLIRSSSGVRF